VTCRQLGKEIRDRKPFCRKIIADTDCCRSVKHIPVEAAVLDGLKQVRLLDTVAAREVGDGAGDFQDAVVPLRVGLSHGHKHGELCER
jgi:hypothetical protein